MPEPLMPPLSFLLDASKQSLQDLELAALSRSANLGRATREEIQQWIEQCALAMIARWMIENREKLLQTVIIERAEQAEGLEDLFGEKPGLR